MNTDVLVVGGGIAGITAAVEAAEIGYNVTLVEKNFYLGGRVVQFYKYFPKLCPPQCGLEILLRRAKNLRNLTIYTGTEVKNVSKGGSDYTAEITLSPRFVNDRCTSCGKCVEACDVSRENDFNFGMDTTKAIYLPHQYAFPNRYVIDQKYCKGVECSKCVEACAYGAIDLTEKGKNITIDARAVIISTGWKQYDAEKIHYLGFGKFKNVVTNLMMERIASPNGPFSGRIVRRSDGKEPKSVAFVQCAGSRDENNLKYCSQVCCLATIKQANYLKTLYPEIKIQIFYIDLRAYGIYEHFLKRLESDRSVEFIRGKVSKIDELGNNNLLVQAEDTLSGTKVGREVEFVVLATGMEPSSVASGIKGVSYDENGFVSDDGLFSCGVAHKVGDVSQSNQDAEAATLSAIQLLRNSGVRK